MCQPVPIASHPSCPRWAHEVLVPHHHSSLRSASEAFADLQSSPWASSQTSRTPYTGWVLCPTVFLAPVGISLEMRQLSRRQRSRQGAEAQAARMGTEPGKERSQVPSAQDWVRHAPGCCGHMWWGSRAPWGLQLLGTPGHLVTSCLLP